MLTNALHLQARWAVPFTSTREAPFATPSGARSVDMMAGGSGRLRTSGGWQGVELPYRDGTLAAVAVLPPEGTGPCAVDAATLTALQSGIPEDVGVRLPRMTVEQTHELLAPLTALGLPAAGDFPALGGPLQVAQVVQETFLAVDEEGTEAAAATGIALEASARVPSSRVVSFDRPFLFLLTDTATRSPLFVAAVHTAGG